MSGPWGVVSSGFALKRLADIQADFQTAYNAIYGNPNLAPDSVIGQRLALESNALAEAWEGLQLAYNCAFPSLTDEGGIDNVMSLAGLTRLPATATVLYCDCVFSNAGTIAAGKLIADSAGDVFAAVSDIVASVSGTYQGYFACVATGPIQPAPTDTLTINTPVSNWTGVSIHGSLAASITVGRNQETLAESRIRRANSLLVAGSATLEAIRAAIIQNVSTVTTCIVDENYTDTTDINGNLPHSIAVVCQSTTPGNGSPGSGDQVAIANQIWAKRAGGINMNGNISQAITDSTGKTQTIKFAYVTQLSVAVAVSYTSFSEETPPTNVLTALTNAIQAVFSAQLIGEDVINGRVAGACYSVPGIKGITVTLTPSGGSPTTGDVSIPQFSIATMGTIAATSY
jgi:hypothetical protein